MFLITYVPSSRKCSWSNEIRWFYLPQELCGWNSRYKKRVHAQHIWQSVDFGSAVRCFCFSCVVYVKVYLYDELYGVEHSWKTPFSFMKSFYSVNHKSVLTLKLLQNPFAIGLVLFSTFFIANNFFVVVSVCFDRLGHWFLDLLSAFG